MDNFTKLIINRENEIGGEETTFVFVDTAWLKMYLAENEMGTLEEFLQEYTSDDSIGIEESALLDGTIAFTYCPEGDENGKVFDFIVQDWKFSAFADVLSQILQDTCYKDASKALDCLLDL